ncbi:MAG: AAA family ATPase [Gammaproteobacteria bacterium]|nr:AAA family ATPase [Gammaproteobacteria bacterium]
MLQQLRLSGFKSIRNIELKLTELNVLIGANGAGKSNLLSFFSLLNCMFTGSLQFWTGKQGGADAVLHYGAKHTPRLSAELEFTADKGSNRYAMNLFHAAGDTLIFGDEQVEFHRPDKSPTQIRNLGAGQRESLLRDDAYKADTLVRFVYSQLSRYRAFQFHDTSDTAHLRNNCEIESNRWLMPDGGNLAAILYKLKQTRADYYLRIVKTIRSLAPYFDDFSLEPSALNSRQIQLRWRSVEPPCEFGPQHLSDGTLRAMALITLLLLPPEDLPALIVLDEPELGLHPYAVNIVGGLIRAASRDTQIMLATQSSLFLEQFEPEQVIVAEQNQGCSEFKRLNQEKLARWLEEYSLSELWEKNVIGGRPTR